MKGTDKGVRLKRFFVGFYAIKGRLLLDNIEIKGQLAADWMKREGVALRVKKPISAGPSTEVDAETLALIEAHAAGKRKPTAALLEILRDESRGPVVHQAVITALSTGPKRAVRGVMELLYNEQLAVREYGIQIIAAILGKDYGFKAKGSEKSRTAAIRALNDALKKDPSLLKD